MFTQVFIVYSLCIQEYFNAENLCFMSTFFNPISVKLLHNVSCFIFARLLPYRKFFVFVLVPQKKNLELMLVMLSTLFWK